MTNNAIVPGEMDIMKSFFNMLGDNFNIEAVCPDYLPESQCWATWRRDEREVIIVSGYDPEEDNNNHWLCNCGHFTTDGYCHCVVCGHEAPWGCDCGAQDEYYDDDLDFGFEYGYETIYEEDNE